MRVGIAWRYFHERSGLPRYCTELARKLSAADDVFLFAHRVETPIPARGFVKFPFFFKSDRIEYGPNTFLNSLITKRGKRRLGLDIINGQNATILGPDVITAHGTWWRHYEIHARTDPAKAKELRKSLLPRFEKLNYGRRMYRHIIAPSELACSELEKYYRVPREDVSIVPDGVDTVRFSVDDERRARWRGAHGFREETVLLHVSTDFLRKGLWTIVKSLPILPENVVAVVVGREDPSRYLDVARSLGVSDRIRFYPFSDSLEDFYNGADIYVFPSFYESFGLSILEAMSCGKPVICGREAGVVEILEDGREAFVLDRWDDPIELAEKIRSIATPGVASRMGREGRRTAERHSWDKTVQLTRDAYAQALRR